MKRKRMPKPIKVPITRGLVDELGLVMHCALLGMQHGDTSCTNWKAVGKVLLTISMASDDNGKCHPVDKATLDASVATLQGIANRELETGSWEPTQGELRQIAQGVLAAEAILPCLDYRVLSATLHDVNLLMGVI